MALSWVGCGNGSDLIVSETIDENAMWWFYSNWPDSFKLENYGAQGTECFGTSSFFDALGWMTTDFNGAVSMVREHEYSVYDREYRQPWSWWFDHT